MLCRSHLDPTVFGEDAASFSPERMLDDNFAKLNEEFPNCWKPFGNGKRACIGRPFAWQEALLAMAMLFQNFNFTLEDPNYNLTIQETLTIKPKGFQMRAALRHDMTPTELEQRLAGTGAATNQSTKKHAAASAVPAGKGKPMAVFYGSNSGTCEALAQRLAADAPAHGFSVSEVSPLDSANQNVPKDRPVVIVTASYEGQPPSNAAIFVDWLENLKGKEMENVSYAVFGCGHHDWVQTFHRIPKLVDATMEQRGAERIVPLACADAAHSDMFSDFETWEDETLWPALKKKYGADDSTQASGVSGLTVEVSNPRKSTLRQDVEEAVVLSTRTLCPTGSIKKHIEIQLPTGMNYKAGDYLAVLPFNPKKTVSRVFRRFQLSWDASLKIHSEGPTTLPTDTAVSAADVLGAYVELSQPATKRVSSKTLQFKHLDCRIPLTNYCRISKLLLKLPRTKRKLMSSRSSLRIATTRRLPSSACQFWSCSNASDLSTSHSRRTWQCSRPCASDNSKLPTLAPLPWLQILTHIVPSLLPLYPTQQSSP